MSTFYFVLPPKPVYKWSEGMEVWYAVDRKLRIECDCDTYMPSYSHLSFDNNVITS